MYLTASGRDLTPRSPMNRKNEGSLSKATMKSTSVASSDLSSRSSNRSVRIRKSSSRLPFSSMSSASSALAAQSALLANRMASHGQVGESMRLRSALSRQLDANEAELDGADESRRQLRRSAIDGVQRRCTALYQQLQSLQQDIHNEREQQNPQQPTTRRPLRIRALEAKRTAYRDELALIQLSSADSLSGAGAAAVGGAVAEAALGAESVVRDAVHLDEAIVALRAAVRERSAVLADAEAGRSELTAVNEALVRKVAHLVNLDEDAIDESAAQLWRAKLDAQRADLEHSVAELRETLALFCNQAYPEKEAPDPITRVPRKHSLRSIINQLLEAYASGGGAGESTYVSCEHVWPPYVELLLRANIAEIHAQDKRLLCLVDFRAH